jgi:hypothetical protein
MNKNNFINNYLEIFSLEVWLIFLVEFTLKKHIFFNFMRGNLYSKSIVFKKKILSSQTHPHAP